MARTPETQGSSSAELHAIALPVRQTKQMAAGRLDMNWTENFDPPLVSAVVSNEQKYFKLLDSLKKLQIETPRSVPPWFRFAKRG